MQCSPVDAFLPVNVVLDKAVLVNKGYLVLRVDHSHAVHWHHLSCTGTT